MNKIVIIGLISASLLGCTSSTGGAIVDRLNSGGKAIAVNAEVQPMPTGLTTPYIGSMREHLERAIIENEKRVLEEARREAEERKRLEEEERLRQLEIQKEQERIANVGFNPNNIRELSGITGDEMYELLKSRGVRDVSHALVQAEETYNINAIILAGLICLESGWGESSRSTGWTNNMSGMGVPSDHSVGYIYESRQASVLDTARQLDKYYLSEGAPYYNGTSLWNVNVKYCTSDAWADKIISICNTLMGRYREMN